MNQPININNVIILFLLKKLISLIIINNNFLKFKIFKKS